MRRSAKPSKQHGRFRYSRPRFPRRLVSEEAGVPPTVNHAPSASLCEQTPGYSIIFAHVAAFSGQLIDAPWACDPVHTTASEWRRLGSRPRASHAAGYPGQIVSPWAPNPWKDVDGLVEYWDLVTSSQVAAPAAVLSQGELRAITRSIGKDLPTSAACPPPWECPAAKTRDQRISGIAPVELRKASHPPAGSAVLILVSAAISLA